MSIPWMKFYPSDWRADPRLRMCSLAARLREHGLETWNRGLEQLAESPFLLGENKRGWRADFDFLLSPKSFNKLIEGACGGTGEGAE